MITIRSHGFKFSRPKANIVFDVSYFKNPWRDKEIIEEKSDDSRRKKIMEFMEKQEGVLELCEVICDVIITYNEHFPNENIQIAICCSAGEYRSPAIVEIIGKMLPKDSQFIINHSENSKI